MLDFNFYNPTRVVFGKGKIAQLKELVKENSKILMIYGGGSIKKKWGL
jgi:NADP-dependent alcohol dehydrogenase